MINPIRMRKKTVVLSGLAIVLAVIVMFVLFMAQSSQQTVSAAALETPANYTHASYEVDVDNPRTLVGNSDYVFVGRLTSVIGTEYKWVEKYPYTNYKVEVLDNIKGELVKGTIEIQKKGGLSEDNKTYILIEDDFMPQVGELYIFVAKTQDDGSLLIAGKNSNIALNVSSKDYKDSESLMGVVKNTKEYQSYLDGYRNQVKGRESERLSIYDVNAQNDKGDSRETRPIELNRDVAGGGIPETVNPETTINNPEATEIPVFYVSGSYEVDVDNPRTLVGNSDYVFVGRLQSVVGTEYKWFERSPYTNYKVDVIDNIKGELVKGIIEIQKNGGLTEDQKTYKLFQDDYMPQVGELYIFVAKTQDDGSLLIAGKNSNIALNISDKDYKDFESLMGAIKNTKEYQSYLDGYINQVKGRESNRLSIYDVNAQR